MVAGTLGSPESMRDPFATLLVRAKGGVVIDETSVFEVAASSVDW